MSKVLYIKKETLNYIRFNLHGRKELDSDISIYVNELTIVKEVTFLEGTTDNRFKFETNINLICKKIPSSIFFL